MPGVLISGASGLLGSNLAMSLRANYEVSGAYFSHPITMDDVEMFRADLLEPGAADAVIRRVEPDWVIHAAAATDVDACQRRPEMAAAMNRDLPGRMANAAFRHGASFVHISTDAVFDGETGGHSETDSPAPINTYGRTKLAGEQQVAQAHPSALILRTNFFGWNATDKRSLAEWIVAALRDKKPLKGFTNVTVSILLVNHLAEVIRTLLERRAAGLYHVGASECMSKFEFARSIASAFDLDGELIEPVLADQVGLSAPRPANLCLNSAKLESLLGRIQPGIEEGVAEFRKFESNGYKEELKNCVREAQQEVGLR